MVTHLLGSHQGPFLRKLCVDSRNVPWRGTYITNHAAGFSCCTREIQEHMSDHINLLQDSLVKGKVAKEIMDAVKDLKDLTAFHQGVSIAFGTSLQHLVDSLFVQLGNFVLLRRDLYLDHVKSGLRQDTWNQLCNAPSFHGGLFPDAVLATAEQDLVEKVVVQSLLTFYN